jgi:hypothetical protein
MSRFSDSHFYHIEIDVAHHKTAVMLGAAFCAWTSLWLIVRLWINHVHDPFLKRLIWSIILCMPLFGWVFYGAFYVPLSENTVMAERGGRWGR